MPFHLHLYFLIVLLQYTLYCTTVNSAFNELGYNEISQFLNLNFFKTDFSQQRYYYDSRESSKVTDR